MMSLQDVDARRAEVRKYNSDPAYKKKVDDERRARKKAEVGMVPVALTLLPTYHQPYIPGFCSAIITRAT